jgi:hypothetical protein
LDDILPVLDRVRGCVRQISLPLVAAPSDLRLSAKRPDRVRFEHVSLAGWPASIEAGSWRKWRGQKPNAGDWGRHCAGAAYPDVTRHDVRERYLGGGELQELHAGSDARVEWLEDSPAPQHGNRHLANHDQEAAVAGLTAGVPTRRPFAVWSLRYLLLLAGVDALIGGVTAVVPASMNATLYTYQAMPLLCVIGLLFWPTAIAFCRGYRRARIGVGFDEFRVVMLAGIVIIAASSVPAGFFGCPG